MRTVLAIRVNALLLVCCLAYANRATAVVIFRDDLVGTAGADLASTIPEVGGAAWTETGILGGEFLFASGSGVQDAGPNSLNAQIKSAFTPSYSLTSLTPGQVLHIHIAMANISGFATTNPFQSTRLDIATNTSGDIALGEFDGGGNWSASSFSGNPIVSSITTAQSGTFDLDLYLDPSDAFGDGPSLNARLTVNGECPIPGRIVGLSTATVLSEARLIRNVDDEVFFDDLTVESIAAPSLGSTVIFQDDLAGTAGTNIVSTIPEFGGAAWAEAGLRAGQFLFASGGGVQDAGPNTLNAQVKSAFTTPFPLLSLTPGQVVHIHVAMANISSTPATNPFQSTRLDIATNTSGDIALGEFDGGGNWSASSFSGSPIVSSITTAQSGTVVLDLYLDPSDAFGDGATLNAMLTVNGAGPVRGTIVGLSTATTLSEARLIRNVDDEVLFGDVKVEAECGPPTLLVAVPEETLPRVATRVQASPNPSRNITHLRFSLANRQDATVFIHTADGRLVRTLRVPGTNSSVCDVVWDGLDAAGIPTHDGLYFCRVQSGDRITVTKVVRISR